MAALSRLAASSFTATIADGRDQTVPLTTRLETFLTDRGIDATLADRLGWEASERDATKLAIPYVKGGHTVNHKYLDIRAYEDPSVLKWSQDKGGEKCLWNYDCLIDPTLVSEPIIITEGEFDAIIAIQAGYPRTVSVPDGAPKRELGGEYTGLKYSYLDDETVGLLRNSPAIIIATDADGPGRSLARDLAARVGRAKCKYVVYPPPLGKTQPCKDLNKVEEELGIDAVEACLRGALWWRTPAILKMSEYPPSPEIDAYECGDPGVDDVFKIGVPSLSVWTGVPGHGKTTFMNHVFNSSVLTHGWRVCHLSFEMPTTTVHRAELRRWFLNGDPAKMNQASLDRADIWIDRHFVFPLKPEDAKVDVIDREAEDEAPDLTWCLDMIEAAALRHEVKVICIDPWNEMEHERPPDMNQTEYIGLAIREIRRAAFRYGVHIAVIAHPHKLRAGEEPSLYSISDSAHWANKPDQGGYIHRLDGNKSKFVMAKRRFRNCGSLGSAEFWFEEETNRFTRATT